MNYNRNLFQQINRLTNEVTGSYRSYTPPEPPVVTDTVTITTQPTDITCNIGDTATFTVVAVSDDETATLSYQWQLYDSNWLNIQGATSSSYTAPTLDEKEVNYRCVITSDKGGTATTDTVTLTVQAVPIDTVTIVNQPSDTTAYIGGEFSFVTVADTDDETATLSYQWQIDVDSTWTDISGATHATYVGTAPETTGTADYRCVVTSTGGGTATSDTATLTVVQRDTITITAQPTTTSGYVGDTITLSVTAVSDNPNATLSYQWQVKDGATYDDISGATSSTYTVPTSTAGTERYRVIVSSDKGGTDVTSNYADVTIRTSDIVTISADPQSTSGYVDDVITLSVTASSDDVSATLSYQWQYLDNSTWTNISGATNSTYTADTTTAGTTSYRVVVTSSLGGTATSNEADIVVRVDVVKYAGNINGGISHTGSVESVGFTNDIHPDIVYVPNNKTSYFYSNKNTWQYGTTTSATNVTFSVAPTEYYYKSSKTLTTTTGSKYYFYPTASDYTLRQGVVSNSGKSSDVTTSFTSSQIKFNTYSSGSSGYGYKLNYALYKYNGVSLWGSVLLGDNLIGVKNGTNTSCSYGEVTISYNIKNDFSGLEPGQYFIVPLIYAYHNNSSMYVYAGSKNPIITVS